MYEKIKKIKLELKKEKLLMLVYLFSGEVIYFPKNRWELLKRNREIKKSWGALDIKALAEKYDLDVSSIYRILKYGRNRTIYEENEPE